MNQGALPQIPGYTTEGQLGRGGMATVYLATQDSMKRKVALKVMSSHLGEDNVWAKRFIQEAQVIAQLSHPNIVPVFDVGEHQGQFYIAMEHMKGGSLKDLMENDPPLRQAVKIIAGVAAGLDFAGEKGFVHRDIKPDNIMFRENGDPVILDFGIVKQKNNSKSKMTQTGVVVGTTSYMSPEQAQGRELDERSDIYSLGIMFYELLTGDVPFIGESDISVLMKHVKDPPPPLPTHLSVFQPLIDKCLAKKPQNRYSRASGLIGHLAQLEPQIKNVMAQQKTRLAKRISEEATQLHSSFHGDSSLSDATRVQLSKKQQSVQQDDDEDITKVLSSAKATIKDFSAEARARRARNNRRAISLVSFIAIAALSYLGYEEFYLAPKERAEAEAKIHVAQVQRQNKIDELLTFATQSSIGLDLSNYLAMDEVIASLRSVLQLEADNTRAKALLNKLGKQYIDLTRQAVSEGNLKQAESYRDYAQQLTPASIELRNLRVEIQQLRTEATQSNLTKQFRDRKIETLINLAEEDLANNNGFSETAYTNLRQVLSIEPENTKANKLIGQIFTNLTNETETNIDKNKLSKARENLETLQKYSYDKEAINQLKEKLTIATKTENTSRKKNRLIAQAKKISSIELTYASNQNRRKIYSQLLNIDPNNKMAKLGILEANKFDEENIRLAIENHEFSLAKKKINTLKKKSPNNKNVFTLNTLLNNKDKASKEAKKLLLSAQQLSKKSDDLTTKRTELIDAYALIQKADSLDPNNPLSTKTIELLEEEYVSSITKLASLKDETLLDQYFSDSADIKWPSDRILNLQLAQKSNKKTKKKRVITGGF